MTEKKLTVKQSLDARQAAFFVQTASKYDSKVQLTIGDKKINAKSIMGTISLNISKGQIACITAEGADEKEAVEDVASILE